MDLVLSAPALAGPGGVQSYLLTVAPQLQRLGHEVWLHAPVAGMMAGEARRRGLRVAEAEDDLPPACDAVLAQDAPRCWPWPTGTRVPALRRLGLSVLRARFAAR